MEKAIYKTGNIIFIRISTNATFIEPKNNKYMVICIGAVYPDEIYTLAEIISRHPNIKGYDNISEALKEQ